MENVFSIVLNLPILLNKICDKDDFNYYLRSGSILLKSIHTKEQFAINQPRYLRSHSGSNDRNISTKYLIKIRDCVPVPVPTT
jgi:hypothetical protein